MTIAIIVIFASLASSIVTGLLVVHSFKIGAQIGADSVPQPRIDPVKVGEIEIEEGDPLAG